MEAVGTGGIERGEIDGVCGWDWSSFKSQRPDWIRDDKVNLLLQVGLEPKVGKCGHGVDDRRRAALGLVPSCSLTNG